MESNAPHERPSPDPEQGAPHEDSQPPKCRVLVVEDDAESLAAMLDVLEELGYRAAGVQSAEGALNRFCEGVFDLLIVDVGLPALSGIQLAESLQARQDIPVIFATGREPPATAVRRSAWLQKPFSIEELGAALAKAQQEAREEAIAARPTKDCGSPSVSA